MPDDALTPTPGEPVAVFETGNITDAVDKDNYFRKYLAEKYVDRMTLRPTTVGVKLLNSALNLITPPERLALKHLVRFLRTQHKNPDPRSFARVCGITPQTAMKVYALADMRDLAISGGEVSPEEMAAITSAASGTTADTIQSLYQVGAQALENLRRILAKGGLTPRENLDIMKACFATAINIKDALKVKGQSGDLDDLTEEELEEKLKHDLALLQQIRAMQRAPGESNG